MRNLLRALPAAVLALLCGASCASTVNRNMASWVGHSADELIARIGPPTAVFKHRIVDGSVVLVYVSEASISGRPAYATTTGTVMPLTWDTVQVQAVTVYHPEERYGWQRYREFTVDRDGIIQGYRWKGL